MADEQRSAEDWPQLADKQWDAAAKELERQRAQRAHEHELLRRAAAIIDPTMPTAPHEARLDWLAKYREVIS